MRTTEQDEPVGRRQPVSVRKVGLPPLSSIMESAQLIIIAAVFVVAVLYSSVGHGGASGYLAVMAFLAVAPEITRPTALVLNLFVASIGTFQFYRAGHFS